MTGQSKSIVKIWLPVIVPMAVNFVGSAWVLVAAKRARNVGACDIGVPWDGETSYSILKRLFPAALEEAETFKRVVSPCIADLHADIVSAYSIVLMIAVASSFISMKLSEFPYPRWHTEDHIKYLKGTAAAISISIFGLLFYLFSVTEGFIDFTGKVRKMLHVQNDYISLIGFWFAMQGLAYVLIFAVWCLFYGGNNLRSLLKHK